MTEAAQQLLLWVNAHPGWALTLLFLAAMLDAVFLLGALVPAGLALFAMGAMVALGTLDLWTTVIVAAAGAIVGDCFSFWLGHHYHNRLFEMRPFSRFPQAIANGRRFFAAHGGKGVLLARFLGPMRAILPSMAGAAGMNVALFVVVDIFAAALWSLAFVLPGAVFGASLGLAAEVAGRLAAVMVVLLVAVWGSAWLTLFTIRHVQNHTEQWVGALLDWSRNHRSIGNFGTALADPDHPETPVLLLIAAVLMALGGLALFLLASPALHPYPIRLDAAVFQTMRDLHTPWGLALAQALLQFGEWQVYTPVAIVAFLALALARKPRAAAHWVAAVAFGAAISAGVYAIPTLPPPYEYFGTAPPPGATARDLVLACVIYAFIPVLVAGGRSTATRAVLYGTSTVIVLLIVLSRLYLGAHWYGLAMASVVIAIIWTGVLGLGYRRHHPEAVHAGSFALPVLAVFLVAAIWQWSGLRAPEHEARALPQARSIGVEEWLAGGYRQLAPNRTDIAGRPKQAFHIQWAAPLPMIEARLAASGWEPVTPLNLLTVLHWLSARTPIAELPVLPQVHAGHHQALVMRYPLDEDRQLLFSLWPSAQRLENGPPVWIGAIAVQRTRSAYRFFRYPTTEGAAPAVDELLQQLGDIERMRVGNVWLLRS